MDVGTQTVGQYGETEVYWKARGMGYHATCAPSRAYDLKINGLPIEVKYCHKPIVQHGKYKYWIVAFKNDPKNSKFTIIHIGPTKQFFIIPSELMTKGKTYLFPMHLGWITEYEDRWDFLDTTPKQGLCMEEMANMDGAGI